MQHTSIKTFMVATEFEVQDCCCCGMIFAALRDFFDRRRKDGKTFYCPACAARLSWTGTLYARNRELERQAKRLEKELARMTTRHDQQEACCLREQRRFRGLKGQLAKVQNELKRTRSED